MEKPRSIVLMLLLSGLLSALAACGGSKEQEVQKGGDQMAQFTLKSSAFSDGARIPKLYTCDDRDLSPPLAWSGAPQGTQSFALIVEDPDAPGGTFIHWVIYNLPGSLTELGEGVPRKERLDNGALQGINDFGFIGYRGPCPPRGKPHRYFFILRALDAQLTLGPGATKAQLEQAMQGHILAEARLMGTYGR